MSETETAEQAEENAGTKSPAGKGWRQLGPGIVVAATGVGAGDLVATLIAGSRFGYALLWAAILGCAVKIALSEGSARYHLATGSTILAGWRSLGRWTGWYFGIYVILWGFLYGATAMSATALPLTALFPILPLQGWAVITGLTGFLFVWFNSYERFEQVIKVMVGVMFVIMIGLAILVAPSLPDILTGLTFDLPEGALFYTLGLIGGVGGTVTTAAYGYWVQTKGWRDLGWLPLMRIDNIVAYTITGLFVVAMLIVGAELLYSSAIALESSGRGLLGLSDVLEARFGSTVATLFLVGFAATALSSVFGVWHGMSLFFADWYYQMRGQPTAVAPEGSPAFRAYLFWLTFPPMILLLADRPFFLVITYGAFGALFMPFLAITLLLLLNSDRVPAEARNGWLANCVLAGSALLFAVLAVRQIMDFIAI
ncbi:Nramp family divalent metal transporter [Altericroceibacterium endophyticum]|uniref:Divalent metal cation transporter n=1 Tax=Altericroceibacterium endophyticum TaxID=1808508 RepID=A0A6I4T6I9_9SPHN|nr:Nramp family divalent metal transporter [Altericroceibacterium endophyticum]MXO66049.1 divalent metal cation transporter [Altericroceibacterium endophyticum]